MFKRTKEIATKEKRKNIVLITFYDKKALGLRRLEAALEAAGYAVFSIFYKQTPIHSSAPTTAHELQLLCTHISTVAPLFIGLSVNSAAQLDVAHSVLHHLQQHFHIPIVCSGAYASSFPLHFLERQADFVVRLDSKNSICQLADALAAHSGWQNIDGLCYWHNTQPVMNRMRHLPLPSEDELLPPIRSAHACLIENNRLYPGDPQLRLRWDKQKAGAVDSLPYSYACCLTLRHLLPAGIYSTRLRSVASIIAELREAKQLCRGLRLICFEQGSFPLDSAWIEEFTVQYSRFIRLPFSGGIQPQLIESPLWSRLLAAGLSAVQLYLPMIEETSRQQADPTAFLRVAAALAQSSLDWIRYALQPASLHSNIQLQRSYQFVKQLPGRYDLLVPNIGKQQVWCNSREQRPKHAVPRSPENNIPDSDAMEKQLWAQLLFLWQFPQLRKKCMCYEQNITAHAQKIQRSCRQAQRRAVQRAVHHTYRLVSRQLFNRQWRVQQ